MTSDPHWLAEARKLIGTKEIPGTKNSPTIMGWAKTLGTKILGIAYNADSVPWCGLFVAHVMSEAGYAPPSVAVRASAWDGFGVPVKKHWLGAVCRFQRPGGGHVAFLTGITPDGKFLRVLGGNQSDAVTETWIEASRLVCMRWPGELKTVVPAPVVNRTGKVSTNEA